MKSPEAKVTIAKKYRVLQKELDDRACRFWAAVEAIFLGQGGVKTVSQATGLAECIIRNGKRKIGDAHRYQAANGSPSIRRKGDGRKALINKDSSIFNALEALVDPVCRGDPMSPLRWTCKSTRKLAKELSLAGHSISHAKVGQLLVDLDYRLQSIRNRMEGKSHPNRNAQFEFINNQVVDFQRRHQPVISVDVKKKELVGAIANEGRQFQKKWRPNEVASYDSPSLADGKGVPCRVYDLTRNQAWGRVGTDHDTAQFTVQIIEQWWNQMGQSLYPDADELLITADGGGSNSSRNRLWKTELQNFGNQSRLVVCICHFPPGTRKWNNIEHRLFSCITKNWRGRPLTSHEVIVNLIARTTTTDGLRLQGH